MKETKKSNIENNIVEENIIENNQFDNSNDGTDTLMMTEDQSSNSLPITDNNSSWMNMIPIILIFFVMYFLLIRPQEKKRKDLEDKVSVLKKGEEVITSGGIFGTIVKVNNDSFSLDVGNGTIIKVLKTSIIEVLSKQNS